MSRGFQVETVFCGTCGESAEGLPDGRYAKGLPEGWVVVAVARYRSGSGQITGPWHHIDSHYYCSVAHLPAEFLPEDEEEES